METILMLIAFVSFVAFIVGMFSPKTVKCSSRGKVALIFVSLFFVSAIISSQLSDAPEISSGKSSAKSEKGSESQEIKTLQTGDVITLSNNVEILFKDIELNPIPGGANLVFTLQIKNNSSRKFFISNCGWKLLDAEKIEVEEVGEYTPHLGFMAGTFLFTIVEPNVGKIEKAGYAVNAQIYYLSVNGRVLFKIPLDEYKDRI